MTRDHNNSDLVSEDSDDRRTGDLEFGYTTGTCAAAASKAAVMVLCGHPAPQKVEVQLPDNDTVTLGVEYIDQNGAKTVAAVRKNAGDDPDVTDGALIVVEAKWDDGTDVTLEAGDGVGVVTRPGLQVEPGEPAINPVPQRMIRQSVQQITDRGLTLTVSVPGGADLAQETFNPRLGIEDGISILGTSGRVRPFSCPALRESLSCSIDIAVAAGVSCPVLVPGHIGERAARKHLDADDERIIPVSNEWGYMLNEIAQHDFARIVAVGHPGKMAKLAAGHWDTHSDRSPSAVPIVMDIARRHNIPVEEQNTTEGLFNALDDDNRRALGNKLARRVQLAIDDKLTTTMDSEILLVNMQAEVIGHAGIHTVTIIGCGPGASEYLTSAAKKAAQSAETVFGAARLLDLFPNLTAETIPVTGSLDDILEQIEQRAGAGEKVAVLVTGDPGIHSLARPVIDRIGNDNCDIIPGISSIQMAFAAVGCSWENVRVISAHHQKPDIEPSQLNQHDRVAVLLGAENAVEWTASIIEALPAHRCFLCEHLTLPEENIQEVDAASLRKAQPAGRSVVIFIQKDIIK